MHGIKLAAALGLTTACGVLTIGPARAESTCQGPNAAAACATADSSGATVRASSDGYNVGPGGVATVSVTESGAAVSGQGSTSNPEPANGWVLVTASPEGPDVSCGTGGEPAAGSGCTP